MTEDTAFDAVVEGPRPSESARAFRARVGLIERVAPALQAIAAAGWEVMGEETQPEPSGRLRSDFVVQFGDLRLRILLFPEEPHPLESDHLRAELRSYLLAAADTDALVVVGDDEPTTAWIADVYDLQRSDIPPLLASGGMPLRSALKEYALRNVFSIDVPVADLESSLPTMDDLRNRLERTAQRHFEEIKESGKRVRIAEKVAALDSLGRRELVQVLESLEAALEGRPPDRQSLENTLT